MYNQLIGITIELCAAHLSLEHFVINIGGDVETWHWFGVCYINGGISPKIKVTRVVIGEDSTVSIVHWDKISYEDAASR
jgi:hypothetical protein